LSVSCADPIYSEVVKLYAKEAVIPPDAISPHALRATAATNALEHGKNGWAIRAARRRAFMTSASRAEDSPTFKVAY